MQLQMDEAMLTAASLSGVKPSGIHAHAPPMLPRDFLFCCFADTRGLENMNTLTNSQLDVAWHR